MRSPTEFVIDRVFAHAHDDIKAIAWDGEIHLRPGVVLAPWQIVHEETHLRQQAEMGKWWWLFLYLTSKKFKLSQEVEAFKAEIAAGGNTEDCADILHRCYRLNLTYNEALEKLAD